MTTKTKTFELTIDERDTLCRVIENAMETNSNCNMEYEGVNHAYVWSTPEAEAEHKELLNLRLKLKPNRVQKSGYILKARLPGEVWMNVPHGEEDDFQLITWEEQE